MIQEEKKEQKEVLPARVGSAMRSRPPVNKLDVSVIVIVCALVVAIACAFLTEFIFSSEIQWNEIGVDTVIISACTVSIYLLLRDMEIRKGRRTEPWKTAQSRLLQNGRTITEKNIAGYAGKYCRKWEDERLDEARQRALERAGISLEEYKTKYCIYDKKELSEHFPELTNLQRETILRVNKIKRVRYDESYIYTSGSTGKFRKSPSSGIHSETFYRLDTLRTVVSTVFTSIATAAILQEVIFNPTAEAVVECVIKLAVTAFFGAIGMIGGYKFAAIREVDEMNARADEQERFINWAEKSLGASWGQDSQPAKKTAVFDEKPAENDIINQNQENPDRVQVPSSAP